MTKLEARELVLLLAYAFARHGKAPSDYTLKAYALGIEDLDHAQTERAIRDLVLSAKFMPAIAEIRERVVAIKLGPQRTGVEAWGDLLRAVGRFGRDREPEARAWLRARDPLAEEALTAIGWRPLCNTDEAEHAPARAKFCDAYNAIVLAGRQRVQTSAGASAPLAGREGARRLGAASSAELMRQLMPRAPESDDESGGES